MTFSLSIQGYREASAVMSSDNRHRYTLSRAWAPGGMRAIVVGHNPSTADADKDDQTIRRLTQLLRDAGYSGFTIVNLFAFRATDPQSLIGERDPFGRENDQHIWLAMTGAPAVIVAWGGKSPLEEEAEMQRGYILRRAERNLSPVLCFGKTKDGAPRHPSRLPRTAKLEPFT